MLKEYFTELFNYDRHVNLQFAALINAANNKDKPAELMSHLLNAQQIWLSRCLGTSSSNYQLWPKWEPNTFNNIIINNHHEWAIFLDTDIDPQQIIVYKNFKGEEFSSKLIDILAHVINHGTHHRAQIGLLLKQNEGIELPSTDYVHYVRGLQ
nr:DinB family protein [uncultured Mucilaginibacter sp.]